MQIVSLFNLFGVQDSLSGKLCHKIGNVIWIIVSTELIVHTNIIVHTLMLRRIKHYSAALLGLT